MIVCEDCGGPLPTPASTGRPRRFCAPPCRARAHRRRTAHPTAEYRGPGAALYVGDARKVLASLPAASAHCVVTSPPYLGQRAYGGGDGQIGTERSLRAHLDALCAVFDEVARVLRPGGTVWVNLADRYSGRANAGASAHRSARRDRAAVLPARVRTTDVAPRGSLLHLPARLGIALGERGWLTRNVITWHKSNALPHRTRGRLQHQTEAVLVLARSLDARIDLDALPERGDVWTIPTTPRADPSHPAVMPVELARRCVSAGCPPGGVVLDPFAGTCTTGVAALDLGRRFVGVELHPPYADHAARRLGITPAARGILDGMTEHPAVPNPYVPGPALPDPAAPSGPTRWVSPSVAGHSAAPSGWADADPPAVAMPAIEPASLRVEWLTAARPDDAA